MLRRPLFHCRKLALLFALLATAVCAPRLACCDESSPTAPPACLVLRAQAARIKHVLVAVSPAPPDFPTLRSPTFGLRRVYLSHCALLI